MPVATTAERGSHSSMPENFFPLRPFLYPLSAPSPKLKAVKKKAKKTLLYVDDEKSEEKTFFRSPRVSGPCLISAAVFSPCADIFDP